MSARCGFPRPTAIPACQRPRWNASWSISRRLSPYTAGLLGVDDDIVVPLTLHSHRVGPCFGLIGRPCE